LAISVFDLFKVGIGPSSSHTVGPMRAAHMFISKALQLETQIHRVKSELFGSLSLTGKGHGSDIAILMGLEGESPDLIDTDSVAARMQKIRESGQINLDSKLTISYNDKEDLIFHRRQKLPEHSNGMKFSAFDQNGSLLLEKIYYSVGGGFIISDDTDLMPIENGHLKLPYDFQTGDQLLAISQETGMSFSSIMMENEKTWKSEKEINQGLDFLWQTMDACISKGIKTEGILKGGFKIKRRAVALHRRLMSTGNSQDPLTAMDWVNLYALAVNEENAAGGRVVTAPTNGAAGIIPAVIKYYEHFYKPRTKDGIRRFMLASAAVGILYKINASISGAEVGCQGEVGVACSMAAAGLTEALGGTPAQVENAAEIGMEHNLGLTCDPIGGLVQVPCIERNAMGAVKAINASRLALIGDGNQKVSLDKVIKTMRETGADMKTKYKETARGGLAVNIIEC
jgi:L-serine dehydratase